MLRKRDDTDFKTTADTTGPKAIITCGNCGTKSRVPADRGTIAVTCPSCKRQGLWSPEPKPHAVTPDDHGDMPETVRFGYLCGGTGGASVLTFKRFGFHGAGAYRLHKIETFPRGLPSAEAAAKAREQTSVPRTFTNDLLDWSNVRCPHCQAPAGDQTTHCGACGSVACPSSIETLPNGLRHYLRCACGAEGEIQQVDVLELTETTLGHVRRDSGRPDASGQPAPSDVPKLTHRR